MKSQDLNRRQARWALYLSRFDYELVRKPGTSMGKADALSRREDHAVGVENDNKAMTVIPAERIRANEVTRVHGLEEKILDRVRNAQRNLSEDSLTGFELDNEGFARLNSKIYVPEDKQLCQDIISMYHDSTPAGHGGAEKTLELVSCYYYWSGSRTDIKDYCS